MLCLLCQSMEINEEADCDKASALVGFPMIVKPQMGAGSAGMHLDRAMPEWSCIQCKRFDTFKLDRY